MQAETKDEDIPQELFERKLKQLIGTSKNLRESGLELRRSLESTIGYSQTASAYVFALLDHKLDGLAALVDPAQQAQNAAEAAARIADLEVDSNRRWPPPPRSGPLPSPCSPHLRDWKRARQPKTFDLRRSRLVRSAASSHESNL